MKRVCAVGVLLAFTGCGTVKNLTDGHDGQMQPYGGVKIAAAPLNLRHKGEWMGPPILWQFNLVDVAASAVGDTLALPVTMPLAAWRVGSRLWYLANYNNPNPPPDEQKAWPKVGLNDQPAPAELPRGTIY